jgi:hypothetical protein
MGAVCADMIVVVQRAAEDAVGRNLSFRLEVGIEGVLLAHASSVLPSG